MEIEFDPAKRQQTLSERGLDMADSGVVFEETTLTVEDDRRTYAEPRYITIGRLHGRMVIIVWTRRGDAYRIIRMGKANDREQAAYGPRI